MLEISSLIIFIYIFIGSFVTLYLTLFYFYTGVMLFDISEGKKTPFRYKVSYVLVMNVIFPMFFALFLKEIKLMHKVRKNSEPTEKVA